MERFAVFLRGINVGGIKVPMAELRSCLRGAGFPGAKTFLQTGNLLLDSNERADRLKARLEQVIGGRFDYTAYAIVIPEPDLRAIVDAYPFDDGAEELQPYVLFIADPKVRRELLAMETSLDPTIERIDGGAGVIYWEVRKGRTLDSPFGKTVGQKRFQSTTTTRNLRTLRKMLA